MPERIEFEHLNLFTLEKTDQIELVLGEVRDKVEFLRSILVAITGKQFSLFDAIWHWIRIARHREALEHTLKRSVNIYVAMVDYFTYLSKQFKKPVVLERDIVTALLENASLDFLTGAYNRRSFDQFLVREIARATRLKRQFSLILLDMDNFKYFNDTYGHQAGDEVLRNIALKLKTLMRVQDVLCRFGGDEFICLLPETNYFYSLAVAERMIRSIRDVPAQLGLAEPLSATYGIAVYPMDAADASSLIHICDRRLYEAKSESDLLKRKQLALERRAHKRVRVEGSRAVIYKDGVVVAEGDILDIGPRGVAVRTAVPLEVGSSYHMELMLQLPFTPARAEASVVYLVSLSENSYRVGFKFSEITFG